MNHKSFLGLQVHEAMVCVGILLCQQQDGYAPHDKNKETIDNIVEISGFGLPNFGLLSRSISRNGHNFVGWLAEKFDGRCVLVYSVGS